MYHFIISGKTSVARREWVKKEFAQQHMPEPVFFDAIMGNTLTDEELSTKVVSNTSLTLGEIGCALSHLAIFEKLILSPHQIVTVFEDDLYFTEDFSYELLKKGQEFIKKQKGPAALILHPSRFKRDYVGSLEGNTHLYKTNEIAYMQGYIINKEAAKNILEVQQPLKFVVDAWRFYTLLRLSQVYCVDKKIVEQAPHFESVIDSLAGNKVRQRIRSQREAFAEYIKTLSPEEQKRISRERIKRTFLRLKDFGNELIQLKKINRSIGHNMKHYIINDPNNTYRKEHVRKEFEKLGLSDPPHFFDAIMGKNLSQEELQKTTKHLSCFKLGEIGCALSHLAIFEDFLKTQEKAVFILEDDIIVDDTYSHRTL